MAADAEYKGRRWRGDMPDGRREALLAEALATLPYTIDGRLKVARRPEECTEAELFESVWPRVNAHLGTTANSLPQLVEQLGIARFADLEIEVDALITRARIARSQFQLALDEAEALLPDALGLRHWSLPDSLSYTRSAADVSAAGRLDAQYYQPAKAEMLARLAALDGAPLSDSFDVIRDIVDPRHNPAARCRNYDLTDALQPVLDSAKELVTFADMDSQKVRFRDGDLAVARLRAYLREIAVVRVEDDIPSVGSSEFYVLRRKPNVPITSAEALMVYLRSPPVQTILKWCQDGSQHPRFAERDLMSIPLPDCVIALNDVLTATVGEALLQRARSSALLEAAKRAVEIAIEDAEVAALTFIAQQVKGVDAAAI